MMQVNNKEGGGGSGVANPGIQMGGPQELKKRPDGEWGTLPANAGSRNELAPLPDSQGQYNSNVQQNMAASINSH